MKINTEKLINLPVKTQSGTQLGKVNSFNLETESQSVLEYIIKPSNLVKELIQGDLIIPRGQVIEINAQKIIVDNNVVGDKNKKTIKSRVKEKLPDSVAMQKINKP